MRYVRMSTVQMHLPMTRSSAHTSFRISVETLESFCIEALLKVGIGAVEARTSTAVLVTTDTFGVFTHGVKNLRGYVRRIRAGGLRVDAVPAVVDQGPGWAVIDGFSALGMVTSTFAMDIAIAKARESGIGYVGVRNSCHYGAAGHYALQAAAADMIGISMCNDKPSVVAPGARTGVMGSNPLAYAVPAGQEHPIFLDIATAAVAGGKVYQAQAFGETIPLGWLVDSDGLPTTDPAGYPQSKTLMPMAGHKGYGLALLIEILSAVITGAAITSRVGSWMADDPSKATHHGAAFVAINVGAIMPIGDFKARIDRLVREIRDAPLAKDSKRIYLPGQMEWERRDEALKHGLMLPADVVANLAGLAEDIQIPMPAALAPPT